MKTEQDSRHPPVAAPLEPPVGAVDWLDSQLAQVGSKWYPGSLQRVHWYPWSAVWRADTASGAVFFKVCAASQAHEPRLAQMLVSWGAAIATPVIAVEPSRGWLLLPDGGTTLRQHLDSLSGKNRLRETLRHWPIVMKQVAELQLGLAERVDATLELGVVDQRLPLLKGRFLQLLAERKRLVLDEPGGLTLADLDRLRDLAPDVDRAAQRLADYGLPDTLDHGDLYDKHIFWQGVTYRLFDWGDASITHPFLTLTAALGSVAARLPDGLKDRRVAPILDAYLEPWLTYGTWVDLREAAWLASRLGALTRALNWVRAMGDHVAWLTPDLRRLYARGVSYWLTQLSDNLQQE